jgi:hypothetical protein
VPGVSDADTPFTTDELTQIVLHGILASEKEEQTA